ncbi:MAG: trypsin-like peptidase domain-containing protein, partial [Rhabdochlamydiaceae bacterium]
MKYLTLIVSSLLLTSLVTSPVKNEKPSSCQCEAKNFSKLFTTVAKQATPACVFLRVEINPTDNENFGQMDPYGNPFGDDFLNKFFGFPQGRQMPPQTQVGQGSGFIVSAEGLIMTNNHVVRGADKIEITLNDGQVRPAKLIGTDPRTDLALVKIDKIDGQDFPFLELGNSEDLEVAEWVIAIGNPFQLQASVTVGVVSALGRQGLK